MGFQDGIIYMDSIYQICISEDIQRSINYSHLKMPLEKRFKSITKFNLNLNILRKIHSYCHGTFPQPPELMTVSMLVTLLQSETLGSPLLCPCWSGRMFLCYGL